jgi:excisionase family DNA binding protein
MTEVIRPPPDPITIAEAARLTGVCRRTIYNWLHTNKLIYVRTAGGGVRIDPASLWRAAGQWGGRS